MIPDDQYNMFLTIWGHFGPNLAYKKILGKFTKVLGFGKAPPHVVHVESVLCTDLIKCGSIEPVSYNDHSF